MSNESRWVGVENSELLSGLAQLVRRGNELTAELLGYLAEVEQRTLYAELGFPSLHAYCVQELRMSEGAAGRRVMAARVCSRFPRVFDLVARGELHLSALCALGPHLTSENASELLAACTGKTRRQADEILAARFPKSDVGEQVRRLPGRELEPLSEARFGVHFTADAELKELLERARDLARYRLPSGDLAGLVKLALATFVQAEEKRRFGIGARTRQAKPTPPQGAIAAKPTASTRITVTKTSPSRGVIGNEATPFGVLTAQATPPGGVTQAKPALSTEVTADEAASLGGTVPESPRLTSHRAARSRHVGMAARRDVYARDRGQCTYVSSDGKRCEARAWLELDHVQPWTREGASEVENLRLRCRAHNLLHARTCFGALHLAAKAAARRAHP